jgi:predicted amidohydrolase
MKSATRRLTIWALLLVSLNFQSSGRAATNRTADVLRIALMHFAPVTGDIEGNVTRIEKAMELAAQWQAHWFVTPALALTGYHFQETPGLGWVSTGPDRHVDRLARKAAALKLHLFPGHLEGVEELPGKNKAVFNTLFVIDAAGRLIGKHRKINTIAQSEAWSTPGRTATLVSVQDYQVGLLICADAWPPEHARSLKLRGADLIIFLERLFKRDANLPRVEFRCPTRDYRFKPFKIASIR